jgi:hypothetical protein
MAKLNLIRNCFLLEPKKEHLITRGIGISWARTPTFQHVAPAQFQRRSRSSKNQVPLGASRYIVHLHDLFLKIWHNNSSSNSRHVEATQHVSRSLETLMSPPPHQSSWTFSVDHLHINPINHFWTISITEVTRSSPFRRRRRPLGSFFFGSPSQSLQPPSHPPSFSCAGSGFSGARLPLDETPRPDYGTSFGFSFSFLVLQSTVACSFRFTPMGEQERETSLL